MAQCEETDERSPASRPGRGHARDVENALATEIAEVLATRRAELIALPLARIWPDLADAAVAAIRARAGPVGAAGANADVAATDSRSDRSRKPAGRLLSSFMAAIRHYLRTSDLRGLPLEQVELTEALVENFARHHLAALVAPLVREAAESGSARLAERLFGAGHVEHDRAAIAGAKPPAGIRPPDESLPAASCGLNHG